MVYYKWNVNYGCITLHYHYCIATRPLQSNRPLLTTYFIMKGWEERGTTIMNKVNMGFNQVRFSPSIPHQTLCDIHFVTILKVPIKRNCMFMFWFWFGTSFEMISPFYYKIFNQMNQILFIFDSSHCTDPVSHWLWLLHRITTAALATGWHLVSPRYQWWCRCR